MNMIDLYGEQLDGDAIISVGIGGTENDTIVRSLVDKGIRLTVVKARMDDVKTRLREYGYELRGGARW